MTAVRRECFGMIYRSGFYTMKEFTMIIRQSAKKPGVEIDKKDVGELARQHLGLEI